MFIGIDHGTSGIRFASPRGLFEIGRKRALELSSDDLLGEIEKNLRITLDEVKLIGMTYSMGDAISRITPIWKVKNRGVKGGGGAGEHVGGGTRVFDVIKAASIPAVLIPGIHRGSIGDPRMHVFSHGASPEKVGVCYYIYRRGHRSFIVSDVSSNTVTVAVADGKIIGALDACIFAPGTLQGPLDLEMIREVDSGLCSANEAFSKGGVLHKLNKMNGTTPGEVIALFASMEISALSVLLKDYGVEFRDADLFLTGAIGSDEAFRVEVGRLLSCEPVVLDRWTAAKGCLEIAEAVFEGESEILGIGIDAPEGLNKEEKKTEKNI